MYLRILINFLIGFVNITVEGFFIERFINTCISKKIFFWNTRRSKSTIFSANIGIKDFKEVARIAKQCKCRIKINRKKGFPFVLNKYRKRKIFAICLSAIVILIITISNFIWNIEIKGIDNEIVKAEIVSLIEQEGVKKGSYKRTVNLQNLINKIYT